MQMNTQVFVRIVEEAKNESRQVQSAAEVAIADLMESETVRFGSFTREYVKECAKAWLDARLKCTP